MHRESLVIVTPALAVANNGNWQTAQRWAHLLQPAYRVDVTERWDAGNQSLMIALHARRSAASVEAWRSVHPGRLLLRVLTGTDLYRDIEVDAPSQRSLALADALAVPNEPGAQRLPETLRGKGPRGASVLLGTPAVQAHNTPPAPSARRE